MLNAFLTFNINALNSITYHLSTNIWTVLSMISVGMLIAMSLKNVIDTTVREEQNIL